MSRISYIGRVIKGACLRLGQRGFVGTFLFIAASNPALATQNLNYSGRLTNANGSPMTGPVEIVINFFRAATDGEPIGPTLQLGSVELVQGLFTVDLKLAPSDIDTVFSNGAEPAYVQVTANGKAYPRQRLLPIPLALRIPVDNSTVEFNTSGLLAVKLIPIAKVEGLSGILGTSAALKGAAGSTMDGYLTKEDWQRFDDKQPAITSSSTLTASSLTTASHGGVTLAAHGVNPGSTGELRFRELDANGQHYAGLKAPDALTTNLVWTLPNSLGTHGQVLSTNSTGTLSWITPKVGTVTQIATGAGLIGGPITISGQISLANTTVIPGYYPRANISVDAQGRITAASQSSDIDLSTEVFGTLPINRGGTATAVTPANGQLLIGNGTGYSLATLTAGTGMIVTNTAGGIKIDATADPATKVSKAGDTMTGGLSVAGNVGLGTTAPNAKLQVNGAISFPSGTNTMIRSDANDVGSSTVDGFRMRQDGSFFGGTADGIIFEKTDYNSSTPDGGIAFVNTGSSGVPVTSMAIRGSGNVGIGTTAPSSQLHVGATLPNSGPEIKIENFSATTASAGFRLKNTNRNWGMFVRGDASNVLAFQDDTASAIRMAIDGNGNVGIGTVSPTARLAVAGGQAVSAYYATTSGTIDWNNGNIQNSSVAAGTMTLNSMIDGGVYTLILSNATGGSYTFTAPGLTFRCKPACPVLVTAGSWTVVTVLKAGSTALLSWGGGYQ